MAKLLLSSLMLMFPTVKASGHSGGAEVTPFYISEHVYAYSDKTCANAELVMGVTYWEMTYTTQGCVQLNSTTSPIGVNGTNVTTALEFRVPSNMTKPLAMKASCNGPGYESAVSNVTLYSDTSCQVPHPDGAEILEKYMSTNCTEGAPPAELVGGEVCDENGACEVKVKDGEVYMRKLMCAKKHEVIQWTPPDEDSVASAAAKQMPVAGAAVLSALMGLLPRA